MNTKLIFFIIGVFIGAIAVYIIINLFSGGVTQQIEIDKVDIPTIQAEARLGYISLDAVNEMIKNIKDSRKPRGRVPHKPLKPKVVYTKSDCGLSTEVTAKYFVKDDLINYVLNFPVVDTLTIPYAYTYRETQFSQTGRVDLMEYELSGTHCIDVKFFRTPQGNFVIKPSLRDLNITLTGQGGVNWELWAWRIVAATFAAALIFK